MLHPLFAILNLFYICYYISSCKLVKNKKKIKFLIVIFKIKFPVNRFVFNSFICQKNLSKKGVFSVAKIQRIDLTCQ